MKRPRASKFSRGPVVGGAVMDRVRRHSLCHSSAPRRLPCLPRLAAGLCLAGLPLVGTGCLKATYGDSAPATAVHAIRAAAPEELPAATPAPAEPAPTKLLP